MQSLEERGVVALEEPVEICRESALSSFEVVEHRLYRLIKFFRSIVIETRIPIPGVEMWQTCKYR